MTAQILPVLKSAAEALALRLALLLWGALALVLWVAAWLAMIPIVLVLIPGYVAAVLVAPSIVKRLEL